MPQTCVCGISTHTFHVRAGWQNCQPFPAPALAKLGFNLKLIINQNIQLV
ncbi:MAG: hypothetical protein RR140_03760 [Clostridia bacterium]